MTVQPLRRTQRFISAQQQHLDKEYELKLTTIIKTFRQNNRKLMQKIEECDKNRTAQTHINHKIFNEKFPLSKYQRKITKQIISPTNSNRSYKNIQKHSKAFKNLRQQVQNQKLASQKISKHKSTKEIDRTQTENSEAVPCKMRVVRVNMHKLVPLSIEQLRQRMKML